jgi:hypothetical protein
LTQTDTSLVAHRVDVLALLRSGSPGDIATLLQSGVIRGTAPKQVSGDYAEYLVAAHLDGQLAVRNNAGFDVITADRRRISVKSRSLAANYYNHISIRNYGARDFDYLVLVEFAADWTVALARGMSWDDVSAISDYTTKVKGRDIIRFHRRGAWRTRGDLLPLRATQEQTRLLGPQSLVPGAEPTRTSVPR